MLASGTEELSPRLGGRRARHVLGLTVSLDIELSEPMVDQVRQ